MTCVSMGILGRILVTRDGEEVRLTPKETSVLMRLATAVNESVATEQICRYVWPEDSWRIDRNLKNQVHKRVLELRKKLGEETIRTEQSAYRLVLDADHCDWLRFGKLVADGVTADPLPAAKLFGQALQMWPEGPLPGVPRDMAGRLECLRDDALRGTAEAYRALGDLESALRYAEMLARLHPDDGLGSLVREEVRTAAESGDLVRRAFPGLDVVLTVRRGDLFGQDDANLAVGFGDTFDTSTELDRIISRDSVQGQLLDRVFGGDQARLDEDLADELGKVSPVVIEELCDKHLGKPKRYAIGTTVPLSLPADNRRTAFAFVHCHQDEGFVTRSTPEDIAAALNGLWTAARLRDMYKPLAMPVVGSGAARVKDLNRTQLIIKIIASFLGSCRENGRCATELRIMVPGPDLVRTSVPEIRRYVRELGADGREPPERSPGCGF